jgi:hypothetical protein
MENTFPFFFFVCIIKNKPLCVFFLISVTFGFGLEFHEYVYLEVRNHVLNIKCGNHWSSFTFSLIDSAKLL